MVRCANLGCVMISYIQCIKVIHCHCPHLHEIMVVKRKGTMGLKALNSWGSRRQNDIQKGELLGAANYMVEVVLPTSTKGSTQIYFQAFNEDNISQVVTSKAMENEETPALSGHRNRKTDDSLPSSLDPHGADEILEAQDASKDYSIYNYSTASYEEATSISSVGDAILEAQDASKDYSIYNYSTASYEEATPIPSVGDAIMEAQDASKDYSIYNYSTASYEETTSISSVDSQRQANQSRDDKEDDDFSVKTLSEEEYQFIMARDEPLAQNEGPVDNFLEKGMVIEVPHARADERSSIHPVNDGSDAGNNAGEAREDPEESTLSLDGTAKDMSSPSFSVERNATSSAPETMLDDGDGVAARSSVSKWRPFKSVRKIKEPKDVAKVGVLPVYANLRNDATSALLPPTGPEETHILADGKAAVDHEVAAKEDDKHEQAEEFAQCSAMIVPSVVGKGVEIQDYNALVDQLDEDISCLTQNSLSTAIEENAPKYVSFLEKAQTQFSCFRESR